MIVCDESDWNSLDARSLHDDAVSQSVARGAAVNSSELHTLAQGHDSSRCFRANSQCRNRRMCLRLSLPIDFISCCEDCELTAAATSFTRAVTLTLTAVG